MNASQSSLSEDPESWFQAYDSNSDGLLSQSDCIFGLSQTFITLDSNSASSLITALWSLFDTDSSGQLSMDEFVKAGGLCDTLLAQLNCITSVSTNHSVPPRPSATGALISDISKNPRKWFQTFDGNNDGLLEKGDCIEGIRMTFETLDFETIRYLLDTLWPIFDSDGSGSLTMDEFLKPGGLCEMILAQVPTPPAANSSIRPPVISIPPLPPLPPLPPPQSNPSEELVLQITRNPRRWFQLFDRNRDGLLRKSDCIEGLTKTFPSLNASSARDLIDALWSLFDSDGSGTLDMEEFIKPSGLCDTILAQMTTAIPTDIPPAAPASNLDQHDSRMHSVPEPPQYQHQSSQPNGSRPSRRRAFFVGINYTGTSSELRGCVADVENTKRLLAETYGWVESTSQASSSSTLQTRILVDTALTGIRPWGQPTKDNVLAGMRWLVDAALPGDVLFFHYSGHGSQIEDPSGLEEDGMNECILPGEYMTWLYSRAELNIG